MRHINSISKISDRPMMATSYIHPLVLALEAFIVVRVFRKF